jgi:hypothetical protein
MCGPQNMVAIQIAESAAAAALRSPGSTRDSGKSAMIPCSRVPGRERWRVGELEGNPRLSATLELLLRSEEGVEEVRANPVTGRVLVRYRPESVSASIETLIRRALEFGPMSKEEFSILRSTPARFSPACFSVDGFVAAELGCTVIKLMLFGSCCPAVLTAAGLWFVISRNARRRATAVDRVRAARIVADQPR